MEKRSQYPLYDARVRSREVALSKSVFVSHAVVDVKLVRHFVEFLVGGIGVAADEIFCSSLPDFGIPAGANSVEYMRTQLDQSLIVIMLMSASYMASGFCQAEMGAAWVKAKEVFPIIVPPTTFDDVKGVMLGKQAIKVDDDLIYNNLRESLVDLLDFTPVKSVRWDQKRKEFFRILPDILKDLTCPQNIDADVHRELEAKYNDALAALEEREDKIKHLEILNTELRKLKDLAGVAMLDAEFSSPEIGAEFNRLTLAAKDAVQPIGSYCIRRLYLARRYDKPFDPSECDKTEVDFAIRRNILDYDCEPRRDNRIVFAADRALAEMENFIRGHQDKVEEHCERSCHSPPEPDNEDFWNEHLLS